MKDHSVLGSEPHCQVAKIVRVDPPAIVRIRSSGGLLTTGYCGCCRAYNIL